MRRSKTLIACAVAACCYVLIFAVWRPVTFQSNVDYSCYYRAGLMGVSGLGSEVYDVDAQQQQDEYLRPVVTYGNGKFYSRPFVYTPHVLALFELLALFPYRVSEWLWFLINVVILLAAPWAISRELKLPNWQRVFSILFPVVLLPAVLTLMHGQVSIVILGLLTMFWLKLHRNQPIAAGVCLAFATIKPQFVLPALVALLAARNWKAVKGFLCSGAALLAASSLLVGWRTTLSFPLTILNYAHIPSERNGEIPIQMANLRGIAAQLFPEHVVWFVAIATTLVLLVVWKLCRHPEQPGNFALLLVATMLVSYHGYITDLVLLTVVLPCVWADSHLRKAAILIVGFVLIPVAAGGLNLAALYFALALICLLGTLIIRRLKSLTPAPAAG